jgi:predicted phage terminase large subunit-like protein
MAQHYITPSQYKAIERSSAYYRAQIAKYQRAQETETTAERDKRIAHLLHPEQFEAFCTHYFPHIVRKEMPWFHRELRVLMQDPECFLAVKWARGYSKTTAIRMALIHLLCAGTIDFPLLIGQTASSAVTLLSHMQDELEANTLLRQDFGLIPKLGHWNRGELILERRMGDPFCIRAFGKGESVRGQQHGGKRPDTIVVDDIDDDEESRNPKRTGQTFAWLKENVLGAVETGHTYRFVIANTILSSHSVMSRACEIPGIQVHAVPAVDAKGQSNWPAKVTLEWLTRQKEVLGYHSYMKEYMLEPIMQGDVFKAEHLHYITPLPIQDYAEIIFYCDPSLTDTGDYKAVAGTGFTPLKTYHVLEVFCKQTSHLALIQWMYDTYARYQAMGRPTRWYVESGFMQELLISQALRDESARRGYILPLATDHMGKKANKEARISALSPLFETGLISISEQVKQLPDWRTASEQLLAFGKGSRAHDDWPDALEGSISKLARAQGVGSAGALIQHHRPDSHRY